MTRSESFDVVVVGARCAGAPLATLLARRNLKVALVERVVFPRDTLSSHVIQTDALAFLDRLGVINRIRATGARFMRLVDTRIEDFRFTADYPQRSGDVGGAACIRRFVLDPILADAAVEAGADMRMGTTVMGLLDDAGRVAGVRVARDGRERELRAPLVVGADGRSSTVARLGGAYQYNALSNERAYYWSFFEGADESCAPTFVLHRWGDRLVFGGPADSGLYIVGVSPEASERDRFRRRDLEASFMEHAWSCEPVAAALAGGARRATKIFGIVRYNTYFREASGPGWVLIGDAGHFKDPAVGRGIGDAFRQVDALVPAIVGTLGASAHALDGGMARWGRWRDDEFAPHYWMGADLGRAGRVPMTASEIVRRLHASGETERFLDLFSHRSSYYDVFTLSQMLAATGCLLMRQDCDRRELLREVRGQLREEVRRRWVKRRPVFVARDAPLGDAAPSTIERRSRFASHTKGPGDRQWRRSGRRTTYPTRAADSRW